MPRGPQNGSAQNGVGTLEDDLHGMRVELVDTVDLAVGRERPRGGRGIGRVLPVEHDVVGGEGLAVVPHDAALELPRHRRAVARHAAVVDARRLGCEHGQHIAVGIEPGERLVEDA